MSLSNANNERQRQRRRRGLRLGLRQRSLSSASAFFYLAVCGKVFWDQPVVQGRKRGAGAWHAAGQKRLPKSFTSSQTFLHILPTKRKQLPVLLLPQSLCLSLSSSLSAYFLLACLLPYFVSFRFSFPFSFFSASLLNALIAIYQIGK